MQPNGMELYRALSELARRYQFRSRDELCCYGLTVSQCYALEYLCDADAASVSEITRSLGLDMSSTTRLIDQLVRKKLVVRQRSPEDARMREVRVTEAGKRLATRVQQDLVVLLERALQGMPQPVLHSLPEALRRITSAMNDCCPTDQIIPAANIRKIGT